MALEGYATIALVVLGVAGVVALIVWAYKQERKRVAGLESLAKAQGWTYRRADGGLHQHYRAYEPFKNMGFGHVCENVLEGDHKGSPVNLFDYEYKTQSGSGKQRRTQTHHYAVLALRMPIRSPGLTIERENIGHKLWDAVGGDDIDFESDEFSRKYWVKSPDRRFAYDVLHARTIAWFLDQDARDGLQWHGDGLVWYKGGRWRAHEVLPVLDRLVAFRDLLPRHLLDAASPESGP